MAIIKCYECGNLISDQAACCIKCGAPVIRRFKCRECGTEYEESSNVCPSCGCPSPSKTYQGNGQNGFRQNVPGSSIPPYQGYTNFAGNMRNGNRDQRVQRFLMANSKFFPQWQIEEIRCKLMALDGQEMLSVECMTFKDPMVMLVISVFLGGLGVDRFILNEIGAGVAKLILCILIVGVIWWLIDIFKIVEKTREYNYDDLCVMLEYSNQG